MRINSVMQLFFRGMSTVIFKSPKPLIGSIILTDRCNLSCLHCAVSNLTSIIYPHYQITSEMHELYRDGVRILLFYGGEPFLWKDDETTLRDLVIEARQMGYLIVNVVTNGTFGLNLPEADLLLVSLDGTRENHNKIRGSTYDTIIKNIENAASDNICLYMAVNQINKGDIEAVCETAKHMMHVRSVSFNFHTPYPGTEYLQLTHAEKLDCCDRISRLIGKGYPVLNLRSAFPYIVDNTLKKPCRQCVIMENNKRWICGRCLDVEGLCEQCGYFFAAEFSLVFSGNIKVICDLFKTYMKYI